MWLHKISIPIVQSGVSRNSKGEVVGGGGGDLKGQNLTQAPSGPRIKTDLSKYPLKEMFLIPSKQIAQRILNCLCICFLLLLCDKHNNSAQQHKL